MAVFSTTELPVAFVVGVVLLVMRNSSEGLLVVVFVIRRVHVHHPWEHLSHLWHVVHVRVSKLLLLHSHLVVALLEHLHHVHVGVVSHASSHLWVHVIRAHSAHAHVVGSKLATEAGHVGGHHSHVHHVVVLIVHLVVGISVLVVERLLLFVRISIHLPIIVLWHLLEVLCLLL